MTRFFQKVQETENPSVLLSNFFDRIFILRRSPKEWNWRQLFSFSGQDKPQVEVHLFEWQIGSSPRTVPNLRAKGSTPWYLKNKVIIYSIYFLQLTILTLKNTSSA